MDFHELLSVAARAQKDNEVKATQKKVFSTKLSAPKKLEKDKVDRSAIKAMLERKAKAKEQKEAEDQERKIQLLKLRAEANHSRMAHAMATRTKDNLKVLTKKDVEKIKKERGGRRKSEEDMMHDQFMKKIENVGSRSTERSKRNEQKVNELLAGPKEKRAMPKKPTGPPIRGPMDFKELMKVAATKQDDPSAFSPPPKIFSIPKKKKIEENGRPMTQKEKDEIKERDARTKSKEYQMWYKTGKKPPSNKTDHVQQSDKARHTSKQPTKQTKKSFEPSNKQLASSAHSGNKTSSSKNKPEQKLDKPKTHNQLHSTSAFKSSTKDVHKDIVKKKMLNKEKIALANNSSSRLMKNSDNNRKTQAKNVPSKKYAQTNSNVLVCGPPKDNSPVSSNPWDRIMGSMPKQPERYRKRQTVDSDSEEYDEELGDFIDDDDDDFIDDSGAMNYSKHIQEIFGYNRRKYARYDDDDDVDNMESSFTQQMKEEARSAKLGMLEDLEDIRKEEEEERRKKMKKKMKTKR